MNKINILQIGYNDWSDEYDFPEYVNWNFYKKMPEKPKESFDLAFLERSLKAPEIKVLDDNLRAYTLYVIDDVKEDANLKMIMSMKCGQYISKQNAIELVMKDSRNFFASSYGEKYKQMNLCISRNFKGSVEWSGNEYVSLNGSYGDEFSQIAFWNNTIPIESGQAIDLWLEYDKDPNVSILLQVTKFRGGSIGTITDKWEFTEEQMEDIVCIDNPGEKGAFFVSVSAKGEGNLKIVALHDRYSRRGYGTFIPGGERFVSSSREEVFIYFDPGDRKPPLNVYFSGYKTREGFEGYRLLKSMGCPFLLVSESRLEGGGFYIGTEEYEELVKNAIAKHIKELGFSSKDLIFAGLSMGTYGSLMYGCDFTPHALILGKPLASIGDVATNEKYLRPEGFPTSLDVLHMVQKGLDRESAERLNNHLWDKFDATEWGNTKFIVSYMIEDDYDYTAYKRLIEHLHSVGVQVYGKGIHGRHNDDTNSIVQWFVSQFNTVLQEDYNREKK